jgi:hypothetical protein
MPLFEGNSFKISGDAISIRTGVNANIGMERERGEIFIDFRNSMIATVFRIPLMMTAGKNLDVKDGMPIKNTSIIIIGIVKIKEAKETVYSSIV